MRKGTTLGVSKLRTKALLVLSILCALPILTTSVPAFGVPPDNASTVNGLSMTHPIPLGVYLNGSVYLGPSMDFNVLPASHAIIILTTTFPWTSFPTVQPGSSIAISLTFNPFPANNGVLPPWLHLSLSSPSISMKYGHSASTNIVVQVDSTAPQAGLIGSFEVVTHDIDPVTGSSDNGIQVIRLDYGTPQHSNALVAFDTASSNTLANEHSASYSTSAESSKAHRSHDPSWAIGDGVCNSSTTSKCNGYGLGWSSVNGIEAQFNYPSLSPSISTYFDLSGGISSTEAIQFTILNPYNGGNNWQIELFYFSGSTPYHAFMGSVGSSGSFTPEIYYSGSTNGWAAVYGAVTWYFDAYISQCCGTSSTFYGINQEPFAFESVDTTAADFSGMANTQSPAFKYSTNGGSSWSLPSAGTIVNSNWSGWGDLAGGHVGTPSWFLEAGNDQCSSVSNGDVAIGYTGYVCSGATNINGTLLF